MPYVRKSGELIFTSSREVIVYYTAIIDELIPQLKGIEQEDYSIIHAEITVLKHDLVNQLKNFGRNDVDEYFSKAMINAESDKEYYSLSNAYEDLLVRELNHIKEKLHTLRHT